MSEHEEQEKEHKKEPEEIKIKQEPIKMKKEEDQKTIHQLLTQLFSKL